MCLFHATTDVGLSVLSDISQNQSIVLSPISIALALSLVHVGAKGQSKDEIRDAFMKNIDDDHFINHFGDFVKDINANGKDSVDVRFANRVYAKSGSKINQDFLDTIVKKYDAYAQNLDFDNKKEAANIVNGFVDQITNGRIKEIVSEDNFANAISLLINALYFKANWKKKLNLYPVQEKEFHIDSNVKKTIPFIRDFKEFHLYAENADFQLLKLPYVNEKYSFSIILPKKRFVSFKELRSKLNGENLQELVDSAKITLTNIEIPKFKVFTEIHLQTALEAIGIHQIFTDQAGLSGIADGMKVADIVTKTVIEIDENGTEGAAATAVHTMVVSAAVRESVSFKADHPFLFALYYKNHLVFLGHFAG